MNGQNVQNAVTSSANRVQVLVDRTQMLSFIAVRVTIMGTRMQTEKNEGDNGDPTFDKMDNGYF